MLTQLTTVKQRLGLTDLDVQYDVILTNAISAISARFDQECRRTLARTANAVQEFNADDREVRVGCYPIESVSKFELKSSEAEGWVEQTEIDYVMRQNCVLSLAAVLGAWDQQGRVTYTGGYVLPGTTPDAGQTPLPADLEQAAVEQSAYWFQNRDKLGLMRNRPNLGTYQQFAQLDLLPQVAGVIRKYERWNC